MRAVHNGRHGHPVIFARAVFQELRHADQSVGARAVVRAYAGQSWMSKWTIQASSAMSTRLATTERRSTGTLTGAAPIGYNEGSLLTRSGPVAQLGARLNGIQEVTGSIPVRSTKSFFAPKQALSS